MKKLLILCLTFTIATELEVDGNLKVTGDIDVQNNPIKNVGPPTALTDAINGNALQDAIRDDGNYEYKIYLVRLGGSEYSSNITWVELIEGQSPGQFNDYFHTELFTLLNTNWKVDSYMNLTQGAGYASASYGYGTQVIILKRPLEDSE